jgi:hypothetical protein
MEHVEQKIDQPLDEHSSQRSFKWKTQQRQQQQKMAKKRRTEP